MRVLLLLTLSRLCASQLPWLTTRAVDAAAHPNSTRAFVIADEFGREVTLRGACVESEERSFPPFQRSIDPTAYAGGQCPENLNGFQEPPICGVDAGKGKWNADTSDGGRNDFAQARALGFNIVRLCLSWSALEPTPGAYSAQYLDRVAQMVGWAKEQDVYVVLDLHEDLYSLFIQPLPNQTGVPGLLTPGAGQDGAPAWAVDAGGWPSLNVLGVSIFNLAVMASFDAFYDNRVLPGVPQGAAPGPGLQDHYIGALAALAARFRDEPTVAGYELMNEPLPGTRLPPLFFGRNFLYPFYARCVQAVTGVSDGLPRCAPPKYGNCSYPDLGVRDARHLIFAEPSALRNELDFSAEDIPAPWTSYPFVVHTPHVYTHVFTVDQEAPWILKLLNVSAWPPSFSFAYDTAVREANQMRAAVFVTEYGTGADQDARLVIPTLDQAERHGVGGTLWSWKTNCVSGKDGACGNWTWSVYESAPPGDGAPGTAIAPNGELFPQRERMLSRVHNRGAVGEVLLALYNVSERSYVLTANVTLAPPAGAVAAARAAVAAAAARPDAPGARAAILRAANGSATEVYLPRSIGPAAANATPVSGAVELLGVVPWPDGSRSAFFAPTAAGAYTVGVPPSAGGPPVAEPPPLRDLAARAAADAPRREHLAAAREAAEGDGRRLLDGLLAAVADAAAGAGYPLPRGA